MVTGPTTRGLVSVPTVPKVTHSVVGSHDRTTRPSIVPTSSPSPPFSVGSNANRYAAVTWAPASFGSAARTRRPHSLPSITPRSPHS